MKKRDIGRGRKDNQMTLKLIRLSKKFLYGYTLSTKHGVRIVDLLDLLIDAGFTLNVTYDLRNECCHISGRYELLDMKFLKVPPEVAPEDLYQDRARLILNYCINLVRFNNRFLLKGEWFKRDMEMDMRPRNGSRMVRSIGIEYRVIHNGSVTYLLTPWH